MKKIFKKKPKENNALYKLAQIAASHGLPFVFDFTKYAYAGDPLRYLFETWKPYYNMKYHMCKSLAPKSILEIGVRYGYSAAAFLNAAPGVQYVGIDNDSAASGGVPGAIQYARDTLKGYNVEFIIADTQTMSRFPTPQGRDELYDLIHVDGQQDGDGTFHDLELALRQGRYILVDGYFWTKENLLATTYFVDKYKLFIDYAITIPGYAGEMLIQVKDRKAAESKYGNGTQSYIHLSKEYDAYYFLNDCGGYDSFLKSDGKRLDTRLANIAVLTGYVCDKDILDIGCGRGELTNRFYEMGASAVGVDYSIDAIDIARSAFPENDRLQYLCEDVLAFSDSKQYDRIIMADVVEHIDEGPLNVLLQKISSLLYDDGYLLIHTSPNKLYYDVYHKNNITEIRRRGVYVPENPRSYYEEVMHINEQTPDSLRKILEQHFPQVAVWTSAAHDHFLEWFGKDCPYDTACSHPDIYAVATRSANTLDVLTKLVDEIYNYNLEWDEIDIEIHAERISIIDNHGLFNVRIRNNGMKTIRTSASHPISISYHIRDGADNIVLHDGERTEIFREILPGGIIEQRMVIRVVDDLLKDGNGYKVVITLVQEGKFWFDGVDKRFSCEMEWKQFK